MATPLSVNTLGGEVYTIHARDNWSVRDLKLAIEKASGVQSNRQQLVNASCEELLDEKPLCNYLSNADAMQLSLVFCTKTEQELQWMKRWPEVTPAWLQKWTEIVLGQSDFENLAFYPPHVLLAPKIHPNAASLEKDSEEMPLLETARQILDTMRHGPYNLQDAGAHIILQHEHLARKTRKALREAVWAAIRCEPAVMIPRLDCHLALEAVGSCPSTFKHLPERYRMDRQFLHAALECDTELLAEFMHTAGKSEINAWQWSRSDAIKQRRKHRR